MKIRSFIPPMVIALGFFSVISIIWEQEYRHYLSVGNPADLAINSLVELDFLTTGEPSYLHFFSEDCRNARINIKHIYGLVATYKDKVNFYIINNSSLSHENLRNKYEVPAYVKIVEDPSGSISKSLQVKTLPYALLTTRDNTLYFGGNYINETGFCGSSDIIWSAPAVALKFLIEDKQQPLFPKRQLKFIGCEME